MTKQRLPLEMAPPKQDDTTSYFFFIQGRANEKEGKNVSNDITVCYQIILCTFKRIHTFKRIYF